MAGYADDELHRRRPRPYNLSREDHAMVTVSDTPQELLDTVQALIRYYAPQLRPSVVTVAAAFAAVALGLFVAFRSAKVARTLVGLFGVAVGAALGYRAALAFGGPGPISAGVGAVLIGALAWRTWRAWLAIGSVAAITLSATLYQFAAKGELSALVRDLQGGVPSATPRLVSAAEQQQNLYGDPQKFVQRLWDSTSSTMQSWGLRGWLWPALALIAGVILAVWALSIIAVMWLALAGSIVAVAGGLALVLMQAPNYQYPIIQRPEYVIGAVGIVWLIGLLWQAKSATFGPKPGQKPDAAA
jgi:hypothetical protein